MDERDLAVRNHVYRRFVELGRAPRLDEIAAELDLTAEDADATLRRLHDAHALVLERDAPVRIRMANPFSAIPTPHRVFASGRWWYANCAWDAFGVCAALGVDGRIESSCPDSAEELGLDVRDQRPSDATLVFHCLVPAARWWDDIAFT